MQLHAETFMGAIKLPLKDSNNKFQFDENRNIITEDKIKYISRKPLIFKNTDASPGFKSLEEIEKVIVDKNLFKIIEKQSKVYFGFIKRLEDV